MPKDIFSITGSDPIDYDIEDESSPFFDLKRGYASLRSKKKEALEEIERREEERDAREREEYEEEEARLRRREEQQEEEVEEDEEEREEKEEREVEEEQERKKNTEPDYVKELLVPLSKFIMDLCRNTMIVNKKKYPAIDPGDYKKIKQRLIGFGVMDEGANHVRYEVGGLYQRATADILNTIIHNYQIEGLKGVFVPLNEKQKTEYERVGDRFMLKFSVPLIFLDSGSGDHYAINKSNNKIEKISIEDFEALNSSPDISQLPYRPITSVSSAVISVDCTNVPPEEPKYGYQFEVEGREDLTYVGPKKDPIVKVVQGAPSGVVENVSDAFSRLGNWFGFGKKSKTEPEKENVVSESEQEEQEPMIEPGLERESSEREEIDLDTDSIRPLNARSREEEPKPKMDKRTFLQIMNYAADFFSQPETIQNLKRLKVDDLKLIHKPTEDMPQLIYEIPHKKSSKMSVKQKRSGEKEGKPSDILTYQFSDKNEVELTLSPNPEDRSIFIMLESSKSIEPFSNLVMDPYYEYDPLVALKVYEAIKLRDLESHLQLDAEDLKKLEHDKKYGAHFKHIKNMDSKKFNEFIAEQGNKPLGTVLVERPSVERPSIERLSPIERPAREMLHQKRRATKSHGLRDSHEPRETSKFREPRETSELRETPDPREHKLDETPRTSRTPSTPSIPRRPTPPGFPRSE